ncbi:protein Flattop [Caloenas nicobarica]|uniref:protein Flattop n=1 Tax=Caloenas nicobarica TaxID=187106 RepID=UPI0032B799A3
MARFGAGQYEDAFTPHRLQNWNVPRPSRQRPPLQGGPTQIIANDRGHLLPAVPRSQVSPWGTFVGTWEMPPRIPPARLSLTSRSAAAATRLTAWTRQPTALSRACNGVRTEITGKPEEPRPDTQTTREPSPRSDGALSEGTELRCGDTGSPQISALREPSPGGATVPGVPAPGRGEEGEGSGGV